MPLAGVKEVEEMLFDNTEFVVRGVDYELQLKATSVAECRQWVSALLRGRHVCVYIGQWLAFG